MTAVYFTFLFSCALLILTTAHFVIGAAVEKVGGDDEDDGYEGRDEQEDV